MMKTRIGIIGCAGMAKTHAQRFEPIADQIEGTTNVVIEFEGDILGYKLSEKPIEA